MFMLTNEFHNFVFVLRSTNLSHPTVPPVGRRISRTQGELVVHAEYLVSVGTMPNDDRHGQDVSHTTEYTRATRSQDVLRAARTTAVYEREFSVDATTTHMVSFAGDERGTTRQHGHLRAAVEAL